MCQLTGILFPFDPHNVVLLQKNDHFVLLNSKHQIQPTGTKLALWVVWTTNSLLAFNAGKEKYRA